MAAIDKLYLKEYWQYKDLWIWANIYYPKLFNYFYNPILSYKEWESHKNERLKQIKKEWEREHKKIYGNSSDYVQNLINYYKESVNYNCSIEQAKQEVEDIIQHINMTDDELLEEIDVVVLNTPCKVDNYLKWRCPLPFVREYLHTQCGVNSKWEWLYRIFWKGKKMFL